jgi:hypothetical protein
MDTSRARFPRTSEGASCWNESRVDEIWMHLAVLREALPGGSTYRDPEKAGREIDDAGTCDPESLFGPSAESEIEETEPRQPRGFEQPTFQELFLKHRDLIGGHFAAIGLQVEIERPARCE